MNVARVKDSPSAALRVNLLFEHFFGSEKLPKNASSDSLTRQLAGNAN